MTQPQNAAQVETVGFDCMDCGVRLAEGGGYNGDTHGCRVETAKVGDVVRMSHMYATRALQKVVFRVTALPNPKATRKAEREGYQITPITGGRPTRIDLGGLLTPSAADLALANRTSPVEPLGVGNVVVAVTARLTGVTVETDLLSVVKANPDGTVSLTRLGVGGGTWSKIPANLVRRVEVPTTLQAL
jgi:hypothetical protein